MDVFYRILADLIVGVHLGFILFSVAGGLLVSRWRGLAWVHIPSFLWAALIEFAGWWCPLTPLENWLRHKGGLLGYGTGFVEHYLIPILYPTGLSRSRQIVLGVVVLGVNIIIYGLILRRGMKTRSRGGRHKTSRS